MKLDPKKLPSGLVDLIPLAERWGIADDVERSHAIDNADRNELAQLAHCLDRIDTTELEEWLIGLESFREQPSREYIAMTCLTMAVEQASAPEKDYLTTPHAVWLSCFASRAASLSTATGARNASSAPSCGSGALTCCQLRSSAVV
jgi:hypothetical protein